MANHPSEKQIGARIRIVAEHLGEASTLFADSGFQPIYVEHRWDGHESLWFGKMPDVELNRLVRAIPDHFYALRAKVRRVSWRPLADIRTTVDGACRCPSTAS